MARARVYRLDVRCPGCGSNWMRKDGFSGGRPAYRWRGLPPPPPARRGLPPSWAGGQGAGHWICIRRQQPERRWADLGLQRRRSAGVGEKKGRQALTVSQVGATLYVEQGSGGPEAG